MENELLGKILEELQKINGRLDGMDVRLDRVDSRLLGLDVRMGGVENRLNRVDARLDKVENDLDLLKEYTQVTRTSVNTLLDWAETAQSVEKVPLYHRK